MVPSALRVLHNRQYALVWGTGALSDIGTWMQMVAVSALIIQITQSAFWGALVGVVTMFTMGLSLFVGGVFADRYDRRRILMSSAVVQAALAVMLAFLVLLDALAPLAIVAIIGVEGVMVGLALPARSAMLPDLVGREHLTDASALGTASWNLGRTLGPAAGGVVLLIGSYSWVFVLNAISFVTVAAAFLFVRLPRNHDHDTGSPWARLQAGVRGAAADQGCSAVIVTVAVMALFISPFIALVPAMAQLVFEGRPSDTARFVTAQGMGSVAVALVLSKLTRRLGRNRLVKVLLVAAPLTLMAFAAAPTKSVALVALFALGFVYFGLLITAGVIIQLRAPVKLRARVISLQMMTLAIVYSLSASVQGAISDSVGVRETLLGSASVFLLVALAAIAFAPGRVARLDA